MAVDCSPSTGFDITFIPAIGRPPSGAGIGSDRERGSLGRSLGPSLDLVNRPYITLSFFTKNMISLARLNGKIVLFQQIYGSRM